MILLRILAVVTVAASLLPFPSSHAQETKKAAPDTPAQAGTIFSERTWTNADSQQSFVGTLTQFQSGNVTIDKEGGPITFSAEKLSQADREFLGHGITFATLDGKTYDNVSVFTVSAGSVTVMKSSGVATIAIEQLPEPMRTRFGFDPVKAKMEREALTKAQKARQAQMAAQLRVAAQEAAIKKELQKAELRDCYVYRFVDDGLIFHSHSFQDYKGDRGVFVTPGTGWGYKQILNARDRGTQYHLKGIPSQPALVDDQAFSAYMVPNGTYESGGSRIKSYTFLKWGGILYEDDQTFDTPTVVREVRSE